MPPSPPDRPQRAGGLEVTEIADGLVVHQIDPERVHHLNNTASVVFTLCDGEHTIPEITALFGETFSLDAAPLVSVTNCVEALRSTGVVCARSQVPSPSDR